jgi:hypothetical protein
MGRNNPNEKELNNKSVGFCGKYNKKQTAANFQLQRSVLFVVLIFKIQILI